MIRVYMHNMEMVLYTKQVEYETEVIEREDDDPVVLVYARFIPNNGPAAGRKHKILVAKIDAIVEPNVSDMLDDEQRDELAVAVRVRWLRERIEMGDADDHLDGLTNSIGYRRAAIAKDN